MMTKTNNKSTETQSTLFKTDRKSLFIGGVIVILIAITPFIFYAYENFPTTNVWENSFFNIKTGFKTWYHFAWFFSGKFVPLYLLLLWFFTCKHWWHWIILIPIAMYSFQLWGVINESNELDELEIYYVLPLMMVIIPAVYLIRAKLFAKIRQDDLKAFEEDLAKEKTMLQQLRDLFR